MLQQIKQFHHHHQLNHFNLTLSHILALNSDSPSLRLIKVVRVALSFSNNNNNSNPPPPPPPLFSAKDANLAILNACHSQLWGPDPPISKSLIQCAILDRDWFLLDNLLNQMQYLTNSINLSLWKMFVPLLFSDAPNLALNFVQTHIILQGNTFLLVDSTIVYYIVQAVRKTRNRVILSSLLRLCHAENEKMALLELRRAISLLSATHPHLFSHFDYRLLQSWFSKHDDPAAAQLKLEFAFHSALSESNLAMALNKARQIKCISNVVPSLLLHIMIHRYPSTLKWFSKDLLVRLLDLRHVPISESLFLAFVRLAPESYQCDSLWYHLYQQRQYRLSRYAALKLLKWVAANVPNRFGLLIYRLSLDCLKFNGNEDFSNWRSLFSELEKVHSDIRHGNIISLHALLDFKRGHKEHLASVESCFASYFVKRSSPTGNLFRKFLFNHMQIFPASQNLVSLIRGSFAPTLAYSILNDIWSLSHSRIQNFSTLSSQQTRDWIYLHYTIQVLSSQASPSECTKWTRRIQELNHNSAIGLRQSVSTKLLNDSMTSLVSSLGRCGDIEGLNLLVASGHPSLMHVGVQSCLATAFVKTDQLDKAEQISNLLDPTSVEGGSALVSVMAAQVRISKPCIFSVFETTRQIISSKDCTKRNRIGSINVQAMALRAQGSFLDAIHLCTSNHGLANSGTLTIMISCAIHAVDATSEPNSRFNIVHELWSRLTCQSEKRVIDIRRDVWAFINQHASNHVHRYHINLLLKLMLGSHVFQPSWDIAHELLEAMDLGKFNGMNTRTGNIHSRPSKNTWRIVHGYMYARLARLGLVELDGPTHLYGAEKIYGQFDPNLHSHRLLRLSKECIEGRTELVQMAQFQEWIELKQGYKYQYKFASDLAKRVHNNGSKPSL